MFTLLGAFARRFVPIFKGDVGQWVGGAVVIAIGLFMIGYALAARLDHALHGAAAVPGEGPAGRGGGAAARDGVRGRVDAVPRSRADAASWRSRSRRARCAGILLLLAYSLGLGVPFLLVGLGVQRFMGAFGWVRRHYAWIAGVSGALLVVVGVLLVTGEFTRIVAPLARFAPGL